MTAATDFPCRKQSLKLSMEVPEHCSLRIDAFFFVPRRLEIQYHHLQTREWKHVWFLEHLRRSKTQPSFAHVLVSKRIRKDTHGYSKVVTELAHYEAKRIS